ncbi:MAG: GT4 family glycosyltransferase PelF [Anaeromicrobium sp.]|jgi:glycosyltransferase involved in cell wall biosynthesis|uniref:GT4 family glycosyltransferase PelF n=1 Tax=Anaeromicrobium sp. TaxID=1929132 RepID=UPI0025E43667|nr:GT4 family glycosyltransferase PelF [Anaeromicrobium sp.]MCT4596069.1 GT4 family glycosyltransferase PelF [Anaeromicrobium sp.]
MRICIIAEGSYPHVAGGVSTWTQSLIENMKEHEFIIYAIGAESKSRGTYKYEIPSNVVSMEEIFLDEFLNLKGVYGKKFKISDLVKDNIKSLILGNNVDFNILFDFLQDGQVDNIMDFFMSKDIFNIIKEAYHIKYSLIPFNNFFWAVRAMIIPLFFLIKRNVPKAHIYHSVSTGYGGIMGALGNYIYNTPFILTEHGIYTREREEEIIKSNWIEGYFKDMWIKFFYNLSHCAYNKANRVISLSEKNKHMQVEIGCPMEKIHVIPNGIDVSKFSHIPGKDTNHKHINIGAVLRLVPIKDVKTMIRAFYMVKEEIKNAKFYIMGPTDEDKEYYKECVNLVKNLNLEDLIFTGRINIKEYLGKMDILVLSSISESQPLAILEGFACRKPFVSTDVGSCKELIYGEDHYGQAGFVVPLMNYERLSKEIIKLCKNKDLRLRMGTNGYDRVVNLYTFHKFIKEYKDLYNSFRM